MTRFLATVVTSLLTLCGLVQPGQAAVPTPMVGVVAYACDSHATAAEVENGASERGAVAAYERDVTRDALGRGLEGASARLSESTVAAARNYDVVVGFLRLPSRSRVTHGRRTFRSRVLSL